ncbi:LysR family transcriptional regulator [Pendulispora rubella]|uniref:LysR family transcriptional regulator n=1 Tax=Pendulispora rubella TaxID=2741070 RepID=A0ABZ2LA30_9BACT
MKDELAGITTFVRVAEKRSFTTAAAELGVTASAVSQTVRQLEDRLGVRLFQRTTRSVSLTEAGQRLWDRVRPALSDVREAVESLAELRDRPAGTLRLTISRVAMAIVLEPAMAGFLAENPEIRFDLSIDDGLVDIAARGFDAGVRLGEVLDKEMIAVRISGDQRSAIVGAPAYFAKRGKPKHPRDLHGHDCIGYRRISSGEMYKWEFDEPDGKVFQMALDGRIVLDDGDLMLRAAVNGLGVAYALEEVARPYLERGELVRVLADYCAPFPGFFLYYPSRIQVPLKLRALIDFLSTERRAKGRARGRAKTASRSH